MCYCKSGAAAKIHGGMPSSYPVVEPGFSSSMQFSGSSYDNHALVAKMHKERNMEAFSAMNSSLLEASSGKNAVDAEQWKHGLMRSAVIGAPEKTIEAQMLSGNHGEEESKTLSIGKVLDHEGGTSNTSGNANKMAQVPFFSIIVLVFMKILMKFLTKNIDEMEIDRNS